MANARFTIDTTGVWSLPRDPHSVWRGSNENTSGCYAGSCPKAPSHSSEHSEAMTSTPPSGESSSRLSTDHRLAETVRRSTNSIASANPPSMWRQSCWISTAAAFQRCFCSRPGGFGVAERTGQRRPRRVHGADATGRSARSTGPPRCRRARGTARPSAAEGSAAIRIVAVPSGARQERRSAGQTTADRRGAPIGERAGDGGGAAGNPVPWSSAWAGQRDRLGGAGDAGRPW